MERLPPITAGAQPYSARAAIPAWGRVALIMLPLAVAVALGLYLRLLAIYSVPFYEDDYSSALQVAGIMQTGRPTFPSGWVQWAEPVVLPYLVSIIWRFTGPDIIVGRLLSAALGTLSIGAAYLLGWRLHSRATGAIFALFVAANVWSVTSSTYFRHYALAELSFLSICGLAVWWLKDRRTLRGYLAVLGGSTLAAVIGHFILLPVIPVVVLLPVIAKVCDMVVGRVQIRRAGVEDSARGGVRIQLHLDAPLLLVVAGLSVVVAGCAWALPRYGMLVPQMIGRLTGEFFTVLPEQARVSFQPFFIESLLEFYGPWMLALVGGGALTLLIQTGRSGLTVLLYFVLPFVILSTIFASLTVTSMFDRYLFPYNPALLLMLTSIVVWAGERVGGWLIQGAPISWRERAGLLTLVVAAGFSMTLLKEGGAFGPLPLGRLPGAVETWIRSRNEPQTPTYQRVTAYLKAHMASTDVVLGTRPLDLAFEMPQAQGYWLMHDPRELSEVGVRRDGQLLNRYTGYPAIADLGQLLNLMARVDGLWVVVPYFHDSPETLSPGMWGVIHSWMERVADASDGTVTVYRSPRQRVEVIPLSPAVRAYGNVGRFAPGDGVTLFRGRPGPLNWAGVEYRLPVDLAVPDTIFEVSILLEGVSRGTKTVDFDVILEEPDGDRWHTPERLRVQAGPQWHRFYLPFSYLRFWPLGKVTPQPGTVTSLKVEVHNARNLAFQTQVQIRMIRRLRSIP